MLLYTLYANAPAKSRAAFRTALALTPIKRPFTTLPWLFARLAALVNLPAGDLSPNAKTITLPIVLITTTHVLETFNRVPHLATGTLLIPTLLGATEHLKNIDRIARIAAPTKGTTAVTTKCKRTALMATLALKITTMIATADAAAITTETGIQLIQFSTTQTRTLLVLQTNSPVVPPAASATHSPRNTPQPSPPQIHQYLLFPHEPSPVA